MTSITKRIDIWDFDDTDKPKILKVFLNFARLLVYTWQNFIKDNCLLRAEALSFISTITLVPLLLVLLFVLKTFGGFSKLQVKILPLILNVFSPTVGETINNYLIKFQENFHTGTVGIIGFGFLIIVSTSLLNKIEGALNFIWGVKKSRDFLYKITVYWSIITLGPLFLVSSLTFTASIQKWQIFKTLLSVSYLYRLFLFLSPFLFSITAFTILYIFLPNIKVHFLPGLLGGLLAGIMWEFAKWGYTIYTTKAVMYSIIYGSLATIPLLLIWIYISWVIVLIGAEFGYALQNFKNFITDMKLKTLNYNSYLLLGIEILLLSLRNFKEKKPPISAENISDILDIPLRIVNELVFKLSDIGLLSLLSQNKTDCFQPAIDLGKLSIIEYVYSFGGKEINNELKSNLIKKYPFINDIIDNSKDAVEEKLNINKLFNFNDLLSQMNKIEENN